MNEFSEYQEMKENGIEARVVYLLGKKNGLDTIALIRMLRVVYGLTLVQAKEVSITADGRFKSLSEYQETLLPALEEALKVLERDSEKKEEFR